MREYRYSLGLLELSAGVCMLVLALYVTLIQIPSISPIWRFALNIVGIPLIFWIASRVERRLPKDSNLATITLSRRRLLVAFALCLFALITPVALFPRDPSTTPNVIAAVASGALVLFGGTGPRVAYLVSGTLLLGLALAIFAPASSAAVLFCIILALVLIPTGIVTLRRELPR